MGDCRVSVRWGAIAGRLGVVACLGAALGWIISVNLDWSSEASRRECAESSGLCVGLAPPIGLAAGILIVVVACWVCFAAVGLRPLAISIPGASVLTLFTITGYLRSVDGGRLHPTWAFALVMAVVFALLAVVHGVFRILLASDTADT